MVREVGIYFFGFESSPGLRIIFRLSRSILFPKHPIAWDFMRVAKYVVAGRDLDPVLPPEGVGVVRPYLRLQHDRKCQELSPLDFQGLARQRPEGVPQHRLALLPANGNQCATRCIETYLCGQYKSSRARGTRGEGAFTAFLRPQNEMSPCRVQGKM